MGWDIPCTNCPSSDKGVLVNRHPAHNSRVRPDSDPSPYPSRQELRRRVLVQRAGHPVVGKDSIRTNEDIIFDRDLFPHQSVVFDGYPIANLRPGLNKDNALH